MDTTTTASGIPAGPMSLPSDATFVSDADEEIFLLYTRLAALKPPDSSDTGHFHGLGSENSKEDSLLVRIELQKPPPPPPSSSSSSLIVTTSTSTSEPSLTSNSDNRNVGRRNRAKKKKREGGSDISIGRGKVPEPVVLEYRLFQDTTALRSRSGDTGSVLWKTRFV